MKYSLRRQFAFGFFGMLLAAAAMWLIPGATARGFADLAAQAAPAPVTPVTAPVATAVPLLVRLTGFLGILVIMALAYLMSHNRRAIRWKTVYWGSACR